MQLYLKYAILKPGPKVGVDNIQITEEGRL